MLVGQHRACSVHAIECQCTQLFKSSRLFVLLDTTLYTLCWLSLIVPPPEQERFTAETRVLRQAISNLRREHQGPRPVTPEGVTQDSLIIAFEQLNPKKQLVDLLNFVSGECILLRQEHGACVCGLLRGRWGAVP